ncbi:MAG: AzlC family ABC transporter permease [Ktedonobacteraceae bacterium]|nr:AzlC family ABC transporter permease [Ktedonobacteraceae bacterium]MBO0791144.1 AzlC family ABC transporter permease [Ktedonobacteraceae bacterium]
MTTPRSEFLAGIKGVGPVLMGVLPFGLIYGVSAHSAGLSASLSQAMSSIVFAGSAQFLTVQLLGAGVPAGIILLTAAVVNLRHALYSASVAPFLKRLHTGWKLLLAYLLTDEAYAVAITHYQQPGANTNRHWYFLGAGLGLWMTWQASTAAGILLGAQVPASWSLDFALPLTFIALVVPVLKQKAEGIAAATAGLCALLAASLPLNAGLLVATLSGILVGTLVEIRPRKSPAAEIEQENSDAPCETISHEKQEERKS